MDERAVEAFHDVLRATAGDRKKVRDLKAAGRWRDAEPDPVRRMQAYRATIEVDYACELAHQKLSDVAHAMARG